MVKGTRKSPSSALRSGNLAVLTPLEGESLQPSNLSAGATNYLNVFFQARQKAAGRAGPCCGCCRVPSGNDYLLANLKMVMFIVDLAMHNMVIFHDFNHGFC